MKAKSGASAPFSVYKMAEVRREQFDEFGELAGISSEVERLFVCDLTPATSLPGIADQFEFVVLEKTAESNPFLFDQLVEHLTSIGLWIQTFGHKSVVLSNKVGPHSFVLIDDLKTPWLDLKSAVFLCDRKGG